MATTFNNGVLPEGFARTSLAERYLVEFSTFTGSDCIAFILPDQDGLARAEMIKNFEALDQNIRALSNNGAKQLSEAEQNALVGSAFGGEIIPEDGSLRIEEDLKAPILPLVGLQSFTISTFRAKPQVRTLGRVNAKGLARGSRTIAGTMILTEFTKDAFWKILGAPLFDKNVGDNGVAMPDQMRPFDVILMFANELGAIGIRYIYGCEINTNGVVYSVQDYYSENTVGYVAQDVSPLIPLGTTLMDGIYRGLSGGRVQLKSLLSSVRYSTMQDELEFLRNSRSPFR